ncbi:hypothetical protein SAY86_008885 [Trapa natans]|uniref:Uncharacterized protein n=1 Tax=Trapa natans TaxID=22666 RepID=A0AAN7KG59_TRANT|nr:hypothetical protein SAY86_008885 [Trapa natans]
MKFLSQMQIQPCFHLTRGRHGAAEEEARPEPIKLIRPEGQVNVYHRSIRVSELMSEFPKHLVCHSDSFYIGQKIQALTEHDRLQLGQKYFLLPSHLCQSVLSFVNIASFVSSQPPAAHLSGIVKKAAAQHQLFHVQKTSSGGLRIRVSDEFISQLMEEERKRAAAAEKRDEEEEEASWPHGRGRNKVCTTAQLKRDYEQMVTGPRTRRWKPTLEAVKERSEKKKRSISRALGMRRRKKNPQCHDLEPNSSSKKWVASSKSRIRTRSRK